MPRVTKKELQRRLDEAVSFQKHRVSFVTKDSEAPLRGFPSFIPVERYPPWCIPYSKEIGFLSGVRHITSDVKDFKSVEDFINS